MMHLGVNITVENRPILDEGFIPLYKWFNEYKKEASVPIAIAILRSQGQMAVHETFIHGTTSKLDADKYYLERLIKTLLWMKGGFRVYLYGVNDALFNYIRDAFSAGGARTFDAEFMADVYENEFEVLAVSEKPSAYEVSKPLGRHLDGCRIGFDAGGSDRKVSAVIDGIPVFSEEVVWHPKTQPDPDYHFQEIVQALKSAAAHMPRVDAIGISSAGIYIDNKTMVASLFLKVPKALYKEKVQNIYLRAAKEIADAPVVVCNDGDVSALAGGMNLNTNNVLGIAMGTSEAAGFLDKNGHITGWLNELAFAPIDAQHVAPRDEWSGDIGCGVKYFSQDAVIRLAPLAGIELDEKLTPAEKLLHVQNLLKNGSSAAASVFSTIGAYLGHTLPLYYDLYGFHNALLLGRVMSGRGGELILEAAAHILKDEYPDIAANITPVLPDEKARRVGQSVAAASLPERM